MVIRVQGAIANLLQDCYATGHSGTQMRKCWGIWRAVGRTAPEEGECPVNNWPTDTDPQRVVVGSGSGSAGRVTQGDVCRKLHFEKEVAERCWANEKPVCVRVDSLVSLCVRYSSARIERLS